MREKGLKRRKRTVKTADKEEFDNTEYEKKYYEKGFGYVAGVDEVGRGPLAGPVVCAAVIMPKGEFIDGVDDSKRLSAKKRERLAEIIKNTAVAYCIAEVSQEEIDRINILQAVRKCMTDAVNGLSVKPDVTLVDGLDTNLPFNAEYIVKGDRKSYTVGCASILAKTYRDALMVKFAEDYPDYEFEKNKGYGSKKHIEAVKEKGPCRLHRKTFIKNFWVEQEK